MPSSNSSVQETAKSRCLILFLQTVSCHEGNLYVLKGKKAAFSAGDIEVYRPQAVLSLDGLDALPLFIGVAPLKNVCKKNKKLHKNAQLMTLG